MSQKLVNIVASGIIFGACLSNCNFVYGNDSRRDAQRQSIERIVESNEKVSTAELIKLSTLEISLRLVEENKENSLLKAQVDKYGVEKTARHLAKLSNYWIDLAERYVNSGDPNVISEKACFSIARRIGVEDERFLSGDTNKIDYDVIKARAKVGKIDIDYYAKLIEKNKQTHLKRNPVRKYDELIKTTFSKEEYIAYCKNSRNALFDYYDALGKTLSWKIVVGWIDIDKAKKMTTAYYHEKKGQIYGEG